MSAYGPMGGQTRQDHQLGRLQQQSLQAQGAHNLARQRMQDDLERQTIRWEAQQRHLNARASNMSLSQADRDEATQRMRESSQLYDLSQRGTQRNIGHLDNQFSASMAQMNADVSRLRRQSQQQTTMNRVAFAGQVTGAVVGAAKSYYSGNIEEQLGQFERRFSMQRPSWEGTSGTRARSLGNEMKRNGTFLWANSDQDAIGGQGDLLNQVPYNQYTTATRRATGAAYITPGLGMQGAAQMQQELGTGQAYYASQMFGLAPTRFAGGAQNSSGAMALSLAQRVNAGNFKDLSSSQLHAQLAQGGSLSMSMANWGRAAGVSGQSLEAMRNQTELLRDLMNPEKKGLKGSRRRVLSSSSRTPAGMTTPVSPRARRFRSTRTVSARATRIRSGTSRGSAVRGTCRRRRVSSTRPGRAPTRSPTSRHSCRRRWHRSPMPSARCPEAPRAVA